MDPQRRTSLLPRLKPTPPFRILVRAGTPDHWRVYLRDDPADIPRLEQAIPSCSWQQLAQCWQVPAGMETLQALVGAFGASCVKVDTSLEAIKVLFRRNTALERFARELQLRRYSPRTAKVYQGVVRRFLGAFKKDYTQLTTDEVRGYVLALIERGEVSASFQNQTISAIKLFFEWVVKSPQLLDDLPRPRRGRRLPAVMSRQATERVLNAAGNLKHQALLVLMYSAGLRVG
ncbi:MAG: site-specific integrase, partial [Candidatus Latescibacteria bacterium]|nr:site-specific integrase [Candidatus Latescibacterota bacterium]